MAATNDAGRGVEAVTDGGVGTRFGGDGGSSGDDALIYAYDLDDGESPSDGVVFAVSEVVGRPPVELEPLYGAVDPDALDALFSRPRDGPGPTRVTFRYEGLGVTVDGTDRVAVER